MYQTARAAFEQIESNIEDAARTLGASEWNLFWKVTVPLAWPGIAAGTILAFARSLGEFGATLMLAGNIPGKTQTIPLAIYFAVEAGQEDRAIAWVFIVLVISFASLITMNYWKKRRYTDHLNTNPEEVY
jgi:molybdate transport system permease protein